MQSVAMSMSMFAAPVSPSVSLPFDIGEKQVSTVFRSARRRGMVERPSTVPVISAVSSPNCSFANLLTLS